MVYNFLMENRTEAILNRFAESWSETEFYFNGLINKSADFERLKPLLRFILDLKQKGENKFFRLGSSMDSLLISRSVNNGLRIDQKFIRMEAYDKKFGIVFRDGKQIYREYMLDNLDDYRVVNLLKTLKGTLVD